MGSVSKVWNLQASEPVYEDCLIAQRKISAAGLGHRVFSTWMLSVVKGADKNHSGESIESEIRRRMRIDLRKTWAEGMKRRKKICGVVSREAGGKPRSVQCHRSQMKKLFQGDSVNSFLRCRGLKKEKSQGRSQCLALGQCI